MREQQHTEDDDDNDDSFNFLEFDDVVTVCQ